MRHLVNHVVGELGSCVEVSEGDAILRGKPGSINFFVVTMAPEAQIEIEEAWFRDIAVNRRNCAIATTMVGNDQVFAHEFGARGGGTM